MVTPVAAAVAGALISGVAMYAVGAKTAQVDAFQTPALVQTVDGGWVKPPTSRTPAPLSCAVVYATGGEPVLGGAAGARSARRTAPRPTTGCIAASNRRRSAWSSSGADDRSWQKTGDDHRRLGGVGRRRRRHRQGQEGRADRCGDRRRRSLDIRGDSPPLTWIGIRTAAADIERRGHARSPPLFLSRPLADEPEASIDTQS